MTPPRPPRLPVAVRAARWSATHPWSAIGLWVAFVVAAVALATQVSTVSTGDADYRHGDSGHAAALLAEGHFPDAQSESALITAATGRSLDRTDAARAAALLGRRIAAVDGVGTVQRPAWSRDRTALLVSWDVGAKVTDAKPMQQVVAAVQREYAGTLRVREAGDVSVNAAVNDRVAHDLGSAERSSLPITLVLMLLAFGALIAAGVPVLLAGTSVAATIGLSAPISHLIHAEPTVSSMIVLIGMAVGVDYSLFYLKRERAERRAGRTTLDAVEIAAATSGHSIVVSGGAVILSLLGLLLAGGAPFNSLAAGAIVVVAVAVLGSLTVLPALLVKLGRWVDRPRVPFLWRLLDRSSARGTGNGPRLLGPVLAHPLAALLVSVVAMGALAAPVLGMRLHASGLDTLPSSLTQVQTLKAMGKEFPAEGTTVDVVVRDRHAAAVRSALGELASSARRTGHFTPTGAPVRHGDVSRLTLSVPWDDSDQRVDAAVRELRGELAPAALHGKVATYAVGGDAAESMDYDTLLHHRMPVVLAFVLLMTLLMMFRSFRSLPVALASTLLNLASVGAAFGVMTLVFQHGVLAGTLGVVHPGFLVNWVPLMVMVILIGLSMDYHVFVVGRIREHVDGGLPTPLAVRRGLGDSAGVVTSAAAVMVSVFAIFATLSMAEMQMMGVGLCAAVLLDATVVRLVMLPAILVLLGDRAWWPGPRVGAGTRPVVVEPLPVLAGSAR